MKSFPHIILLAAVLLGGLGCANVSTLQTGRALRPGESRFFIGAGSFVSSVANQTISDAGGDGQNIRFPYLEFGARVGLFNRLDAGAKLTLPGFVSGDLKYQFFNTGPVAMAVGFGLNYLGIHSSSSSGSSQFSASLLDLMVPLYLSYDVTTNFAVYSSAKALFRTRGDGTGANPIYAGGTVGLKIGDQWGLFLEGTWMKTVTSRLDDQLSQVNGAIFFDWGRSSSSKTLD